VKVLVDMDRFSRRTSLNLVIAALVSGLAAADQEAPNQPYVTASASGAFYARSVPSEAYGEAGQTTVYRVGSAEDRVLYTFPWYAPQIHLEGLGFNTVSVVRLGPWARGSEPQAADIAFALYKNEALVRSVSAVDLVGLGAKPQSSISHYTLIDKIVGIRRPWGNQLVFEVVVAGDKRLIFDLATGEVLAPDEESLQIALDHAKRVIGFLKTRWWIQRRDTEGIQEHLVTEEELSTVARFPELPPGYAYVAGRVRDPVTLEKRSE
jgi:hypothetical protein